MEVRNMNKKLLALLATGALIITGCATKGNVKNKEDDNKKQNNQITLQNRKRKKITIQLKNKILQKLQKTKITVKTMVITEIITMITTA